MSNYNDKEIYEVNNITVSTLLSNIREGIIAIPEIQRPFVWKTSQVRDLLDSLYKNYPIGYLIVWNNPKTRLKDGSLSEGKKVIIDGQQRLTALAAALDGQKVFNDNYQHVNIKIAFNPKTEHFEVSNAVLQRSTEWIPDISELFKTGFSSYNFVNSYSELNEADPDLVNNIVSRLLNIINNQLGIISLPSTMDLDVVTEIFTRINSKGIKLSQADFAMSKIAANKEHDGHNLRKTIDYFCHLIVRPQDYENISMNDTEFASTGYLSEISWIKNQKSVYKPSYEDVIRVIFGYKFKRGKMSDFVAVLSGRNFEKRTYEESIIDETFSELKDGIEDFCNAHNFKSYLNRLHNIGMIRSNFIQSQGVLNFGYMLFLLLKNKGVDSIVRNECVERWLALSTITKRYSSSSETRTQEDINAFDAAEDPRDFIDRVEEGELSDSFWKVSYIDQLETSNTPTFYLFLMAQIRANNRGFLSTETVESMLHNQGDIHHIFPKDYLTAHGYDMRQYNQIANKAMVQKEMNIKISNLAPVDYLDKYNYIERNYADSAIPENLENMTHENYKDFLLQRRFLMSKKIRDYYLSFKNDFQTVISAIDRNEMERSSKF